MPRLRNHSASNFPFDFHEVIAAIAPRSIFVNAPLGDSNFAWKSVDRVVQSALPAFALYGVSTNIVVEHPDVGHLFPKEARQQAFKMIERVLPPPQ
jgi:hypothetical protein